MNSNNSTIKTVLSLFDGISGAQLAFKKAGLTIETYYASEVDNWAKQVTLHNFPETTQLGDVCALNGHIMKGEIDLLIGGSPCQGFSMAGKKINFEDPRSKLLFEYVRILKECKPKYFMLENVPMIKQWVDVISSHVKMTPIKINSSRVSAQDRLRLYWTNIPIFELPKDKKLVLKDIILENEGQDFHDSPYLYTGKYTLERDRAMKRQVGYIGKAGAGQRIYTINDKSVTLTFNGCRRDKYYFEHPYNYVRRLTPIECERLQTFPDNYTNVNGISNTKRYQLIGNAFTVDVIAYLLSGLIGSS